MNQSEQFYVPKYQLNPNEPSIYFPPSLPTVDETT